MQELNTHFLLEFISLSSVQTWWKEGICVSIYINPQYSQSSILEVIKTLNKESICILYIYRFLHFALR